VARASTRIGERENCATGRAASAGVAHERHGISLDTSTAAPAGDACRAERPPAAQGLQLTTDMIHGPHPHRRTTGFDLIPGRSLGRRLAGLALMGLMAWPTAATSVEAPAAPAAAAASAPARGPIVSVVAGIVGYTRWPGDATSVRLCTLGQGAGVDELLHAAELGSAQRSVTVRTVAVAHEAWKACDAIYVGSLGSDTSRDLFHELVGRPVLLLGEGAGFCSDGGMFCLEPRASAVRFQANLDAIARSGLRVNPMVLRIARPSAGSVP